MINLITKIDGVITQETLGNICVCSNITAEIKDEDYININGILAFLQNFKKVSNVTKLDKPIVYGLKNNKFTELNISY